MINFHTCYGSLCLWDYFFLLKQTGQYVSYSHEKVKQKILTTLCTQEINWLWSSQSPLFWAPDINPSNFDSFKPCRSRELNWYLISDFVFLEKKKISNDRCLVGCGKVAEIGGEIGPANQEEVGGISTAQNFSSSWAKGFSLVLFLFRSRISPLQQLLCTHFSRVDSISPRLSHWSSALWA